MSLNKACLIGNVGKDPEIRSTQGGTRVANLSIATSDKWKDKQTGEKKEQTEWHRVVIWGPLVDVVERYVKKGMKLYIEGKIQTRKWTDQQGVERYSTEIVLQGFDAKLEMLSFADDDDDTGRSGGGVNRDGSGAQNQSRHERPAHDDFSTDLDDEIPF